MTKTKQFHDVLDKFWSAFSQEIAQFSPTTSEKRLEPLKKNMYSLKDDFNIDAHQLGSFRDEKSLLKVRSDLNAIIQFLRHIEKQIE